MDKVDLVLQKILSEMAQPSYKLKRRKFFHGTNEQNGLSILNDGHIKIQDTSSRRGMLTPVDGRAYLTAEITTGITYAIGGLFPSISEIRGGGEVGYLFVISGNELGDIQPDEDNLGELVYSLMRNGITVSKWDDKMIGGIKRKHPQLAIQFLNFAKRHLTENQFHKIQEGEYSYYATGGKRLLKTMPEGMKLGLVEAGMNVSTDRSIGFSEAWKITNETIPKIKKNGSNFFDVAERVK